MQVQSPIDGVRNPYADQVCAFFCQVSFQQKKSINVLVKSRLKRNHECALVAEKATGILECLKKVEGEDRFPVSALDAVLVSAVQDRYGYTGRRLV